METYKTPNELRASYDAVLKDDNKIKELLSNVQNITNTCILSTTFLGTFPPSENGDLQMYRLRKSFYIPNAEFEHQLSDAALSDFAKRMAQPGPSKAKLRERVQSYCLNTNDKVGGTLLKAKYLLRSWLSDYKPNLSLEDKSPVGPGSNASYTGGLSEIEKLVRNDRWPVSRHAKSLLWKIVIRNPVLRAKCLQVGWANAGNVSKIHNLRSQAGCYVELARTSSLQRLGFEHLTRREGLVSDVLTTVPKNNSKRRVIAMAHIGDQIAETAVASGIEAVLNRVGNNIRPNKAGFDGQHYHRLAIANPNNATIDLSNASDSNYWEAVSFLLEGTQLEKDLKQVRVKTVQRVDTGEQFNVPILSTMGRRVTFLTMTLVLCAICCTLEGRTRVDRADSTCPQVFGDDIIISNNNAELLVESLGVLGYKVNDSKTFINSSFRESCGSYYRDGVGYLTSYDFEPPKSLTSCIAFTNKALLNYLSNVGSTQGFWLDLWKALFEALKAYVPRGPVPTAKEQGLGQWLYDPDFVEEKQSCNKQLSWLQDCYQDSSLCAIFALAERTVGREFPASLSLYQRRIAIRDGRNPTTIATRETTIERFIINSSNGSVIGTLEDLRRQRAEYHKRTRQAELRRYLRALAPTVSNLDYWVADGYYDS